MYLVEHARTALKITRGIWAGNSLPLVWYSGRYNFGDELAAPLMERLAGRRVRRASPLDTKNIVGLGSIIAACSGNSLVMGAGFLTPDQRLRAPPKTISFVRGKLTCEKLKTELGVDLSVPYCDYASLFSMLFPERAAGADLRYGGETEILVIAHYCHRKLIAFGERHPGKIKFLSTSHPYDKLIDEISRAKIVMSTALHPLIVSDSLNKPTVWLEAEMALPGRHFKFMDYYSSTSWAEPVCYKTDFEPSNILGLARFASQKRWRGDPSEIVELAGAHLSAHFG